MALVTTTTADVMLQDIWAAELNRGVKLDIVIAAKFRDRSSELAGNSGKAGDVLRIVSRHHLTANTKSGGTALTPEAITETAQTFTVNTHQATAQTIEDIAEIQTKYDIRAEYNTDASYSLARAMDVSGGNLFDDNTLQTVGVFGSELLEDNLLRGRQYLRDSGFHPPFELIIPTATYHGLVKLERFSREDYTGDESGMAVHDAQVGKVYGSVVYESLLVVGTAPNASGALFKEGHFFKIVQRSPTPHSWYSPNDLAWVLSTDQIYGMFELQEAVEAAAGTTSARLGGVEIRCRK